MAEQMGAMLYLDPVWAALIAQEMGNSGVTDASPELVQTLWTAYQDAILEKKLPPFIQGQKWEPTFQDIISVTGLPKQTVSGFLVSLRKISYDRSNLYYLDPAKGAASVQQQKDIVSDILRTPAKVIEVATQPIFNVAKQGADIISGPLKWVAIGLAGAAVLYVGWQLLPILTAGQKAKRKGK